MLKKIVALLLVCLVINVAGVNLVMAGDKSARKLAKREAKIRKRGAKVKKAVRKLGAGKNSVVKIKLRNKTKIKGYISEIGETSFTVVDKTGKATVVEYNNTKQIRGNNLHAGVWVAVGVGIALVAILVILSIAIDD